MFKSAARMLLPHSKMGYDIPSDHWFQYVRESTRYSPDAAKLEEYEYQLFFACDETQRGHMKHDFIQDGEYKTPAFTQASFNYWQGEPWSYVVPMEATGIRNVFPGIPPIAKIKGEIHKVRPASILRLDSEKQNGVQFLRQRVRLIIPHRKLVFIHDKDCPPPEVERFEGQIGLTYERMCVIRAWMYVGIPEYWDKLISTFDYRSVQTYESKNRSWCKQYYQLRK